MKLLRHLPNALTSGNLICGCIGIIFALEESLITAAYLVWLACVFDFLDGFAARTLKVTSSIGKQLDSLADMVSFGVLPSMIMFSLMHDISKLDWLPYFAFTIAIFSALRLARFNIDETQKDSFIGLPTPANAIFMSSLIFLSPPLGIVTSNAFLLVAITITFSVLLVAPIPLFALKFKTFRWTENKLKFTFLGLSVLLFVWQKAAALPLIIILYIGLSLAQKRFPKLLT